MSESKQPQLLEPHPLSLLFPPMSDAAFEDFVADIKANGLTSPIVVFEDKVLEGVHRQKACLQAGVEPRYTPYQGNNPLGFVLSANLHRRHLDASQRALIADKLATMKQGRPGKDAPVHVSRNAAATALNVSKRSVADAALSASMAHRS
jgi:ParB-like chromosome segregation protein Spo0J